MRCPTAIIVDGLMIYCMGQRAAAVVRCRFICLEKHIYDPNDTMPDELVGGDGVCIWVIQFHKADRQMMEYKACLVRRKHICFSGMCRGRGITYIATYTYIYDDNNSGMRGCDIHNTTYVSFISFYC